MFVTVYIDVHWLSDERHALKQFRTPHHFSVAVVGCWVQWSFRSRDNMCEGVRWRNTLIISVFHCVIYDRDWRFVDVWVRDVIGYLKVFDFKHFVGAFSKRLLEVAVSFDLPVRLSACNKSTPIRRVFVKFYIGDFALLKFVDRTYFWLKWDKNTYFRLMTRKNLLPLTKNIQIKVALKMKTLVFVQYFGGGNDAFGQGGTTQRINYEELVY